MSPITTRYATIVALPKDLLEHLRAPCEEGIKDEDNTTPSGDMLWKVRPSSKYIGIGAPNMKKGNMVCARASLVQGARLLLFRLRHDGIFKITRKPKADRGGGDDRGDGRGDETGPKVKMATTQILVVALKMRFWRPWEDGVLTVINVHLRYQTAKGGDQ